MSQFSSSAAPSGPSSAFRPGHLPCRLPAGERIRRSLRRQRSEISSFSKAFRRRLRLRLEKELRLHRSLLPPSGFLPVLLPYQLQGFLPNLLLPLRLHSLLQCQSLQKVIIRRATQKLELLHEVTASAFLRSLNFKS